MQRTSWFYVTLITIIRVELKSKIEGILENANMELEELAEDDATIPAVSFSSDDLGN